jgi:hypothetical protein
VARATLLGSLLGWTAPSLIAQESRTEIPALIAIALDTSGSVRPDALEPTTSLAMNVFDGLPPGSQCAVFTFDDISRLALGRTANRSQIRLALERATPSGRYTALHDVLFDASRYLVESPPSRKAILLLTDGKDENSALVLEDALAAARSAEIPVFAVGIGAAQERELRRIAKLTGGEYAPLDQVSGARIASQILALERDEPSPRVERVAPATEPATQPTPRVPRKSARPSVLWFLAAVFAALVTAVVGGIIALRHRGAPRRSPPARPPGRASPRTTQSDRSADAPRTLLLQPRPALAIISGPGSGRVFPLSERSASSIGRSSSCEIDVDDLSISSRHCRIESEAGLWVIIDLDSTNGTFVNERQIERYELASGDIIRVGETSLQFRTR